MPKCRCIDPDCNFNKEPTLCQRKEFFFHASKLPNEKIIYILLNYQAVKYPHALNRLTLLNLFTDLSIEPTASQIIDESRHKKVDS